MCSCRQSWIMVAAALLVAACLGCPQGETPNDPDQPNGQPGTNKPGQGKPKSGSPTANDPPREDPPAPPKVVMTQEQLDTCVVRDGDIMPDGELPDLDGNLQTLSALRAEKKLTVVCFWRSGESLRGQLEAVQTLQDLEKDFFGPYSGKGVQVIGINEGDQPEVVRQRIADAEATFPNLLDQDGTYFAKVAAKWLPRVYLLDAEGKILWFDLEFSLATRRGLKKWIQVELGEI